MIIAEGHHILHYLNNTLIVDCRDDDPQNATDGILACNCTPENRCGSTLKTSDSRNPITVGLCSNVMLQQSGFVSLNLVLPWRSILTKSVRVDQGRRGLSQWICPTTPA